MLQKQGETEMVMEARRAKPAQVPEGVRLVPFNGRERDLAVLDEALTRGGGHDDLRDWIQLVDAAGELRALEGVDCEENIGRVAEMLHHTDGAPAVLFRRIPGYQPGYRILVNAQGERRRLAVSLGLPVEIGTWELMDEDGPITEHVQEGDDVDLLRFPTPLWHPQDGGRYLGTGDAVITRDPD